MRAGPEFLQNQFRRGLIVIKNEFRAAYLFTADERRVVGHPYVEVIEALQSVIPVEIRDIKEMVSNFVQDERNLSGVEIMKEQLNSGELYGADQFKRRGILKTHDMSAI